jgi:hypothetical protein
MTTKLSFERSLATSKDSPDNSPYHTLHVNPQHQRKLFVRSDRLELHIRSNAIDAAAIVASRSLSI